MTILATVLFFVGAILFIAGNFWFLWIAFKENVLWVLACLFIPVLGALAFLVKHFPKAWPPMAVTLVGGVLWAIGAALGGDPLPSEGPLP